LWGCKLNIDEDSPFFDDAKDVVQWMACILSNTSSRSHPSGDHEAFLRLLFEEHFSVCERLPQLSKKRIKELRRYGEYLWISNDGSQSRIKIYHETKMFMHRYETKNRHLAGVLKVSIEIIREYGLLPESSAVIYEFPVIAIAKYRRDLLSA